MGIDEADFYEAIASFTGASKRLEKIAEGEHCVVYKDFAHSPSKVSAVCRAVREQYPDRRLIACLELHTYSSLNEAFLSEYNNALAVADSAVVFYSPEAVAIKGLAPISPELISRAFKREDLMVFTTRDEFKNYLEQQQLKGSVVLLMSSGDYGGLDLAALKRRVEAL
jgi:UDP-N-acetylmuramate: L-alanyl-gamma-D-glutamyl-meso-diaminopimelate ligase